MEENDIFFIVFIGFGIYCAFGLKKDYVEYKATKHYLELNIFLRNLVVVIASVVLVIYGISKLF